MSPNSPMDNLQIKVPKWYMKMLLQTAHLIAMQVLSRYQFWMKKGERCRQPTSCATGHKCIIVGYSFKSTCYGKRISQNASSHSIVFHFITGLQMNVKLFRITFNLLLLPLAMICITLTQVFSFSNPFYHCFLILTTYCHPE